MFFSLAGIKSSRTYSFRMYPATQIQPYSFTQMRVPDEAAPGPGYARDKLTKFSQTEQHLV